MALHLDEEDGGHSKGTSQRSSGLHGTGTG
jgi:hypothetical protein